ncbi:WD domain-containing protein [Microdochium trichocladiopsis]|uniref:WD domain-containing protein n=1 Tax=Microdochium trichocladiopsis TaxID=1682393 RepID=A0A9P9BW03_9PEZI|nr:WD domain-containing protein [Microdochium trichocladiopsis]KAH7040110.1 WD domain-containing protein [Microdochium trichocladiopsis]
MASTPSNRLRLTPSNSPFLLPRPGGRSPLRSRTLPETPSRFSLKRVVGTTCASPTGFDTVGSSFAYTAGGAAVVVDAGSDECQQRFFRARPTAVPVYSTLSLPYSPSMPSTPKANDSRNRSSLRESSYGAIDWSSESPSSKTWTSRERIKAATCLSLSREGRFLAVGETGYAPRVLIFGLDEESSTTPLVSISEHTYGVRAVAWSPDSKYLASLGSANDGFLYVWRIDPRTGAARLFQQNRCTSFVQGMVWVGSNLLTFGVRHIKIWRVEERRSASPTKRMNGENSSPAQVQKTLPGRNVLLGNMIEATFSCAAVMDSSRAVLCTEMGDVCLFDDSEKQMKLTKVVEAGSAITCASIKDGALYLGGRDGAFMILDIAAFENGSGDCIRASCSATAGIMALGFVNDGLVTLDSKHSIEIRKKGDSTAQFDLELPAVPMAGHGESILGVESLANPKESGAAFCTWSGSGNMILWDVDGKMKSSFQVPLEQAYFESELDAVNQLTVVKASPRGAYFITGDKLGVLRVIAASSKECVSVLKVHSSDCQSITSFETDSKFIIASCGRDRITQLVQRMPDGTFEHFQTLEFAAKVVEVLLPSAEKVITCSLDRTLQFHDIVSREDNPNVLAAITAKSVPLKASPTSMAVAPDGKSIFVSLLDRSVCAFGLDTGKANSSFKCTDECGIESVVLDSLIARPGNDKEPPFLLGISNTDKSIRVYDSQVGVFLDREWGHTEAINGVILAQGENDERRVVSVGSDGTIMIWEMDLQQRSFGAGDRDPSPEKEISTVRRTPLRRVLSKAELAEFQRPPSSAGSIARRSPPRTLPKRRSIYNLASSSSVHTPLATLQSSPSLSIAEDTPSRRPSNDSRYSSPPTSPKGRLARRASSQTLGESVRKASAGSLRGYGTLNMATEQVCRTLRSYRKKLVSTEPISQELLAELDQELRFTAVALGDRVTRSKAMTDTMLNGLLDQYSERLLSMMDEKIKQNYPSPTESGPEASQLRPKSSGSGSSSGSF